MPTELFFKDNTLASKATPSRYNSQVDSSELFFQCMQGIQLHSLALVFMLLCNEFLSGVITHSPFIIKNTFIHFWRVGSWDNKNRLLGLIPLPSSSSQEHNLLS